MAKCVCCSEKEYKDCCGKFLTNQEIAETALELMRSRYSAYVLKNATYLNETSTKNIEEVSFEPSEDIKWLSLKINSFSKDEVTFSAYYKSVDNIEIMKEHSFFKKEEGKLKYDSGKILNSTIQRNELCPCGSKKKYKKCCDK